MAGIIYEDSLFNFVLITLLMGGAAAWMAGRACAMTWRPYAVLIAYLVILGAAIRYIHYAPFGGTLLSLHYYLVDFAVAAIFGLLGYRYTRVRQMATRYSWLFEASGPLNWKAKN
jgi:hypothetical protein